MNEVNLPENRESPHEFLDVKSMGRCQARTHQPRSRTGRRSAWHLHHCGKNWLIDRVEPASGRSQRPPLWASVGMVSSPLPPGKVISRFTPLSGKGGHQLLQIRNTRAFFPKDSITGSCRTARAVAVAACFSAACAPGVWVAAGLPDGLHSKQNGIPCSTSGSPCWFTIWI